MARYKLLYSESKPYLSLICVRNVKQWVLLHKDAARFMFVAFSECSQRVLVLDLDCSQIDAIQLNDMCSIDRSITGTGLVSFLRQFACTVTDCSESKETRIARVALTYPGVTP